VGPGDVILIPANAEHTMETLEDFVSLTCKDVVKRDGEIVELRCAIDPATIGGNAS
jgi:quercetin dioxygenase-like cupin family protein